MKMALEFSKSKVEKAAKAKERTLDGTIGTDNKSALRAIARFQAAKEIYAGNAEATDEALAEAITIAFYAEAKFQPSWKDALEKHAPALLNRMQEKLGAPQPRGRRPATVEVTSATVGQTDPDAILGTETSTPTTNG